MRTATIKSKTQVSCAICGTSFFRQKRMFIRNKMGEYVGYKIVCPECNEKKRIDYMINYFKTHRKKVVKR